MIDTDLPTKNEGVAGLELTDHTACEEVFARDRRIVSPDSTDPRLITTPLGKDSLNGSAVT